MTTQPEALRLADTLEKHLGGNTATKAADELRRLHEVNAELLAALKEIIKHPSGQYSEDNTWSFDNWYNAAQVTIAKGQHHERR